MRPLDPRVVALLGIAAATADPGEAMTCAAPPPGPWPSPGPLGRRYVAPTRWERDQDRRAGKLTETDHRKLAAAADKRARRAERNR